MTWVPVNLAAPEFARPTEPPYICGLLYEGKRHAISGPPESVKTVLACIVGLEHMRAGKGNFALLDFEMGERGIRRLLEDLGATCQEIASVYYVAPDAPPSDGDIVPLIDAGVTLVIIDAVAGAYDVSGLDDNKRADAEAFSRAWVTPLWQRGVTTLQLDHVNKNLKEPTRFAIGSERKLGAVDVHLGLQALRPLRRGGDGLIRITTHKDRPGYLQRPVAAQLDLHSDAITHAITWKFTVPDGQVEGGGFRPTGLMERVTDFLLLQSGPISRNTIEKAVKGKAEYIRKAIDALVEDGAVTELPPSGTTRLYVISESPRPVVPSSSQLVPDDSGTSSPRPPLYEGDEDEEDAEVERLLTKHADIANPRLPQ